MSKWYEQPTPEQWCTGLRMFLDGSPKKEIRKATGMSEVQYARSAFNTFNQQLGLPSWDEIAFNAGFVKAAEKEEFCQLLVDGFKNPTCTLDCAELRQIKHHEHCAEKLDSIEDLLNE